MRTIFLILIIFFMLAQKNAHTEPKIIKKISEIKNFAFDFEQLINDKKETGNCIIAFNNKKICKYDETGKLIVSNGKTLLIKNKNSNFANTYKTEKFADGKERTLLALKPHLSPIKAAIIPLKRNNEEIVSKALDIKRLLQSLKLGRVLLDNSGNIGKSYRRHDEIGTPMCVTVDFQSLEDDTITVRDRDSMEQVRISYNEVSNYFQKNIS